MRTVCICEGVRACVRCVYAEILRRIRGRGGPSERVGIPANMVV